MFRILTKAALIAAMALLAATSADAQRHHRRAHRSEVERPPPPIALDKRDTVVAAPGAFAGKPYWLTLAQCGGSYFKLNTLYTDAAVHARVVHPDPHANATFTKTCRRRSALRPRSTMRRRNFWRPIAISTATRPCSPTTAPRALRATGSRRSSPGSPR